MDIYRLDLTDGDYMYAEEPWTFDANDASDRPYTSARAEQSDVPSFAADAAVTVSAVTKNSAVVHFPAAQAASDENVDMIQAYRITLTPDNGGAAKTVQVFSDYYKDASRQREEWTVKVTGLEQGVTYLLEKTVEYAQSLVDSGATNGVTDAAKAAFDKALSDAKAVLEKENPTQAEVDAAVEALASAMNGLTAETTPQPTQTPEASQTPEATQKPVVSEKPETNVPQTGDASQLAAMVGVLMSSATALGGVAIARKRRNG